MCFHLKPLLTWASGSLMQGLGAALPCWERCARTINDQRQTSHPTSHTKVTSRSCQTPFSTFFLKLPCSGQVSGGFLGASGLPPSSPPLIPLACCWTPSAPSPSPRAPTPSSGAAVDALSSGGDFAQSFQIVQHRVSLWRMSLSHSPLALRPQEQTLCPENLIHQTNTTREAP